MPQLGQGNPVNIFTGHSDWAFSISSDEENSMITGRMKITVYAKINQNRGVFNVSDKRIFIGIRILRRQI